MGLTAISFPAAWLTMADWRLAPEEATTIVPAVQALSGEGQPRPDVFITERAIADELDRMGLPSGSIMTDAAYSFSIILESEHPEQFVIPSDRDWRSLVAYPKESGVEYLLLLQPDLAPADAVRAEYGSIYEDGAGIASFYKDWCCSVDGGKWRLLSVDED